jgi:hypothetical protein
MATAPETRDANTLVPNGAEQILDEAGKRVVEEIDATDRRRPSRGGTFEFASAAAAAAARAAVEGIAWRAQFATRPYAPWPERVDVRCDPHEIERVVAILLSHGGKHRTEERRAWYPHHQPLSMNDGYHAPHGLQARMADVEKLRARLAKWSGKVDFYFDRNAELTVRVGETTVTYRELSEDEREEFVADLEKLEEFVTLTRRLLELLE